MISNTRPQRKSAVPLIKSDKLEQMSFQSQAINQKQTEKISTRYDICSLIRLMKADHIIKKITPKKITAKAKKNLLFGILIIISAIIIPTILVFHLGNFSISNQDINNIPLFTLIILIGLIGTFFGGTIVGKYISLTFLSFSEKTLKSNHSHSQNLNK